MNRFTVATLPIALAIAAAFAASASAPAVADTLEVQVGDHIDTYDGVVLELKQNLKLQRLQFGAVNYTSRMVPWEVAYGTWTINVNDQFLHGCEITSAEYKVQGPVSIVARCTP